MFRVLSRDTRPVCPSSHVTKYSLFFGIPPRPPRPCNVPVSAKTEWPVASIPYGTTINAQCIRANARSHTAWDAARTDYRPLLLVV